MWGTLAVAAGVSVLGTWLARRYALARRLLDEPGERRSHHVATPRGGGVGLVLASAVVLVVFGMQGALPGWGWLLAALLAVALVGAWDDHRSLGVVPRLAVHALAAVAVALALPVGEWPWAAVLLAVATVVLVNVWNFMDGIDGIAASQAALVMALAAIAGPAASAPMLWALAVAVIAFLPFNFPRASIFMGDVGSGALGVLLVVAAMPLVRSDAGPGSAALLLFPSAAFLVDASLTLARRMLAGERWWTPHTRHLYQVAARRFSHVRVTLAYAAWSALGCLIAIAVMKRGVALMMTSLGVWYLTTMLAWAWYQGRKTHGTADA